MTIDMLRTSRKPLSYISVPVYEESSRTLRLRTELAHGTGPLGEFEMSLNVDNRALIVRYAGRQCTMQVADLTTLVLTLMETAVTTKAIIKDRM